MVLAVCANPSVDSFWTFPDISLGTTNRSQKEMYYPGGKGMHAGFALNELNEEVTILGIWGGQTGQWLKDQCKQNGIAAIGPTVKQWNRICLTLKSPSDWNETELLGHGPDVQIKTAKTFLATYRRFISKNKPDAVIMCGSTPAGLEPKIYHRLVSYARQQHISTFVDASGSLLQKTLDARPTSIHINQHEGKVLSGFKDPTEIANWLADYCTVAAVTAGRDGLYLQFDNQLYNTYYHLDSNDIISTIGSGDCLFAGLCLAIINDNNMEHSAKYAAACGSANCIHPPLGMLKKQDVDTIFNNVKLQKLID